MLTRFGHSDEIRISTTAKFIHVLCESFLYVEGRLTTKKKNENTSTLGSDCVAFMFDDMRYELNGVRLIAIKTLEELVL